LTCLDDDDDSEDGAGRDIRSWPDVDIQWVTDELASRIKAATAAAAATANQESSSSNDVAVHAPFSQTVQLVSCVSLSINKV